MMIKQSVNGDEYRVSVSNTIRCVLYALEHQVSLREALTVAARGQNDECFWSNAKLLAKLQWDLTETLPDDFMIGHDNYAQDSKWSGTCEYGGWSDD